MAFQQLTKYPSKYISQITSINSTQLIIIMIAFIQGVLQLSDLAISYLYKDDFKLSPSELSHVVAITSIPWLIKPLWGMISDNYYIFGYKRKSYLILLALVQCCCWNILAVYVNSVYEGVLVLISIQTCVAFCNVIGEALLVEVAKSQENLALTQEDKQNHASHNVTLFFTTKNLGALLTVDLILLRHIQEDYYFNTILERQVFSILKVFQITSFFPFILFITSFFLKENKLKQRISKDFEVDFQSNQEISSLVHEQDLDQEINKFKFIFNFIKQKQILIPISFIFIFLATPSSGCVMFYFYTNELHFQPDFMGKLKLIHSLQIILYLRGNILGIIIYNKFFRHLSFKTIFVNSGIFCSIAGLSQILLVTHFNQTLGIPDKFFSICDSMILTTLAEINMIPVLVMACRLCPKNSEGTMYAILMSVVNFAQMISYQIGGVLTFLLGINEKKFDNLWILVLISNILLLIPLPFAYYINFDQAQEMADEKIDYEETVKYNLDNQKDYLDGDTINELNETLKYI